jgi:ferredoxin
MFEPDGRGGKKDASGRFVGRRKTKPKFLAVVTDACTGCAGSPVCQLECPVRDCMPLVPADDLFPGGRVVVDPLKCVGCGKCVAQGPDGMLLRGCPWDAIVLVPTAQWEAEHGVLPY